MRSAPSPRPCALTVAGSDPTGGAGLQLDLQVFRAHGVHGAGVVTALTVQDTAKVHQVLPAFPQVVLEQLRVLLRDARPGAIKLGMLASDDVVRAVAHGLEDPLQSRSGEPPPPLVIDPVLRASDGTPLLEARALPALKELIARAALVTPNLFEAAELVGRDVSSRSDCEAAARALCSELGAGAALVKGGHRERDADDCLAVREAGGSVRVRWLEGARIEGAPVHGTGCALAAAVAARLARGEALEPALEGARGFVREAIAAAWPLGSGAAILGLG